MTTIYIIKTVSIAALVWVSIFLLCRWAGVTYDQFNRIPKDDLRKLDTLAAIAISTLASVLPLIIGAHNLYSKLRYGHE